MVIRKNMTNLEIYNTANLMLDLFQDTVLENVPVKVSFYFQKNMNNLVEMARELEHTRIDIIGKYGTYDAETQEYNVENEELFNKIQQEINELFTLTQEVKINTIKLDWFEGVNFNSKQVEVISFMIEEEYEAGDE